MTRDKKSPPVPEKVENHTRELRSCPIVVCCVNHNKRTERAMSRTQEKSSGETQIQKQYA